MTTARDKLLHAAGNRFYHHGINATGIDAITTEAGVAKKSLYNNFASKAALVDAYIDHRHQEWLSLYRAREEQATSPAEKVLAVFDAYIAHAMDSYDDGFRGCGLLNAAAEFPAGTPARQAVNEHKQEVEAILAKHLTEHLAEHPTEQPSQLSTVNQVQQLAEHLSFLLEGAVARAGLEGTPQRLHNARLIAARMLAE
ncbi:TetR/AcrR family transcriptional regulator [Corynebacterium ammoniagenes]|uniref:Transcriptional regulator, TetR family n=1 Tax=Corynebacterium ammoniagenes DSM 20306 TaxID=649754 RepID=A0ABP2IHG8_CORAM|nr:TetR/AcrR family transcriptional regulator [Corynebacterium ammoniagenes]APT82785.1 TetR family transcriptional regulator [Corynebacterium ammoniagenes DSM 20306]AQS73839.1 TetR family transcriptional regulator [Corynebacterium ammoniagenes]EFG80794.1 transcriptional regulator, TetR family [Corynebacterium ammoniagenes DSM 20306]